MQPAVYAGHGQAALQICAKKRNLSFCGERTSRVSLGCYSMNQVSRSGLMHLQRVFLVLQAGLLSLICMSGLPPVRLPTCCWSVAQESLLKIVITCRMHVTKKSVPCFYWLQLLVGNH